jgi:type VI secretion system protein ImpB
VAIQDEIPRSRLTLTYRTTINGEPETVDLPFRMLVMGDFSLGTSEDRKKDLDVRALRSLNGRNLDSVMKDMKMSVDIEVPDRISPEDQGGNIKATLPITSIKSFNPDEIVKHVPKLKALMLLKSLLQELQSSIDNQKDLRKLMQELYSKPEIAHALREQLKAHEGFKLPAHSTVTSSPSS